MAGHDGAREAIDRFAAQYVTVCCCGGTGFVRTNAPVGHPLFGEAIPCICQTDKRAREQGQRLRRMSGLSEHELLTYTFEAFDPRSSRADAQGIAQMAAAKALCEAYAGDSRGWLLLVGGVGSGKTHLAAAIAVSQLNRGLGVFMATMPDILDMLRGGYDDVVGFDERFDALKRIPLLVIDDLGSERKTDWVSEKLYQLVNARYENRRALVITSNVDPRRATVNVESRVLSRLLTGSETADGWTRVMTLPAGDYRRRMRERL